MNPDKCKFCHQLCDPFDPEYCVWNGDRWHVSCALKQSVKDINILREKQGLPTTTAANYSALQARINDAMDQHEGLQKIARTVPDQAYQLGLLFIRNTNLIKRSHEGKLIKSATDPKTTLMKGSRKLLLHS